MQKPSLQLSITELFQYHSLPLDPGPDHGPWWHERRLASHAQPQKEKSASYTKVGKELQQRNTTGATGLQFYRRAGKKKQTAQTFSLQEYANAHSCM